MWTKVRAISEPGRIIQSARLVTELGSKNSFTKQQLQKMDVCDTEGQIYLVHQGNIYASSTQRKRALDRIGSSNYADDNAVTNGCKLASMNAAQALIKNTEDSTDALTVGLALIGVQTNLNKSYVSCSPRLTRLLLRRHFQEDLPLLI